MACGSDGTYSVSIANDVEQLVCGYLPDPPQTSRAWDGTYDYTYTAIELDESGGPEPGPDTSGGSTRWRNSLRVRHRFRRVRS